MQQILSHLASRVPTMKSQKPTFRNRHPWTFLSVWQEVRLQKRHRALMAKYEIMPLVFAGFMKADLLYEVCGTAGRHLLEISLSVLNVI